MILNTFRISIYFHKFVFIQKVSEVMRKGGPHKIPFRFCIALLSTVVQVCLPMDFDSVSSLTVELLNVKRKIDEPQGIYILK